MSKIKKIYMIVIILITLVISVMYFSYAFLTSKNEEKGKLNIVAGTLDYKIESEDLINNEITVEAGQTKEILIKLTSLNSIDSKYELYYTLNNENEDVEVGYSSTTSDSISGTIDANGVKKITVIIRNNSDTNAILTFLVKGGFVTNELVLTEGYSISKFIYVENILNGADPVLSNNLVPVQITDNGTVTKANTSIEWYSYEDKNWANAVVLKDTSIIYKNNEIIPESNIESYFVWIPKYSYQLWDIGNYTGLTSISNKTQTININFGLTNTSDSNIGECTTPAVAGESGNCSVGDYMTHPAFLAFNSNGFWVGKFETGYDGATTTAEAQQNSVNTSKIIIKPNVYSWRNLTVGNAFKNSYDYLRSDESHMMKNTEWGAVAYLQHSSYGSATSVRINNNSSYITGYAAVEEPTLGYNSGTSIAGNRVESTSLGVDGTYTVNYLNTNSKTASTTGNKSGIYDMSGGAWEYVMGYTTGSSIGVGGSSEITSLYSDFFTNSSWNKYYDKYTSTVNTNYNNRILGDATGEMGPFQSQKDPDGNTQYKSSWYGDYAHTTSSTYPWFYRGSCWHNGTGAGTFAFYNGTGDTGTYLSFRIVLMP